MDIMWLIDQLEMFPIHSWRDYEKKCKHCPPCIPTGLLALHKQQAQSNHNQSVQTLASRGGLCPIEMYAVLTDQSFHKVYDIGFNKTLIPLQQMVDYINDQCGKLIDGNKWLEWIEQSKQYRKDNNLI